MILTPICVYLMRIGQGVSVIMFGDHSMSFALRVVLKDFYNKAAIFVHVAFEPYLDVCYMELALGVFVTNFGDQSMSLATRVVLKRFFTKRQLFYPC